MTDTAFEGWAVVELMGHRSRPGYVEEVEIAGGKMLRIDIPLADGTTVTEFYGASAIYSIRPTTQEIVKGKVDRWNDPRPIKPLEYKPRDPEPEDEEFEDECPI